MSSTITRSMPLKVELRSSGTLAGSGGAGCQCGGWGIGAEKLGRKRADGETPDDCENASACLPGTSLVVVS